MPRNFNFLGSANYGAPNAGTLPAAPSLPASTGFDPNALAKQLSEYQQGFVTQLPQYNTVLARSRGELPQDVLSRIYQSSAERGIATGSYGSPNANAAMLRSLGLTSLDLQGKGIEEMAQLYGLAPRVDPNALFVGAGDVYRGNLERILTEYKGNLETALQDRRLGSEERQLLLKLQSDTTQRGLDRAAEANLLRTRLSAEEKLQLERLKAEAEQRGLDRTTATISAYNQLQLERDKLAAAQRVNEEDRLAKLTSRGATGQYIDNLISRYSGGTPTVGTPDFTYGTRVGEEDPFAELFGDTGSFYAGANRGAGVSQTPGFYAGSQAGYYDLPDAAPGVTGDDQDEFAYLFE